MAPLAIDLLRARRLALLAAGLLRPEWIGLRPRGRGLGRVARESALRLIEHFGYLQLDTVSVAGARSHALVLWSRHPQMDPDLGEDLLREGEPLFEYWGHEASWMPLALYPFFAFRREAIRSGAWCRRIHEAHPGIAAEILRRVRDEGPIRSSDLDGNGEGGWWGHKPAKRVLVALWSSGELAVRRRQSFQRTFDLPERVIPERVRSAPADRDTSLCELLALALRGHGWATSGTLASTWRLRNLKPEIERALGSLRETGRIEECRLQIPHGRPIPGWIHADYLTWVDRVARLRPSPESGVVLSPFDPVLWDRKRVALLFGFEQTLEIFKPAKDRKYGYYCLPVLAGERFVGRVDPKADWNAGRLHVLAEHVETKGARPVLRGAVSRFAGALGLDAVYPR